MSSLLTPLFKSVPILNLVVVAWVAGSYPTLYGPTDCSLPVSSVHGILQARTPERVAIEDAFEKLSGGVASLPLSENGSQPVSQGAASSPTGRRPWSCSQAACLHSWPVCCLPQDRHFLDTGARSCWSSLRWPRGRPEMLRLLHLVARFLSPPAAPLWGEFSPRPQ